MIIDNFEKIYTVFRKLNVNNIGSEYYFVISIIKRLKDLDKEDKTPFENIKESQMVYRTFIIRNTDDILKYKDYIKYLCNKLHARAYITSSPRKFSDFLGNISYKLGSNILYGDKDDMTSYENLIDSVAKSAPYDVTYDHCIYVLDIDKFISEDELEKIKDAVKDKYIDIYKTFSGYHMLLLKYDAKKMKEFLEKEFHNTGDNKFIEQKGCSCRMLLYGNI